MAHRKFILVYWTLFLVLLSVFIVCDGIARRQDYIAVKGKVIDQIPVRKRGKSRSYEVMMPQVIYPVNDSNYIFVDHYINRKVGAEPTIFYRKDEPRDAQIYTIRFWFNFPVIIPTLLLSGFLFCIILISITKYEKKSIRLRGHFDRDAQ